VPLKSSYIFKGDSTKFNVSGILFRIKFNLHLNYCIHKKAIVKRFPSPLKQGKKHPCPSTRKRVVNEI
jgi:hypothetical protein